MKTYFFTLGIFLSALFSEADIFSQGLSDSCDITGQLTVWDAVNVNKPVRQQIGARYLPGISYTIRNSRNLRLDFDASVNIYTNLQFTGLSYDTIHAGFKPYRLSARLSSDQWEIRAGLQKISFGSASILRPLMWFDKIDARDPLQLTDGVYGILGRYYFLNNANIWIWGLYGNKQRRGWDNIPSVKKEPEFGGRLQLPLLKGEIALSCHHRTADYRNQGLITPYTYFLSENKIGLDGKWDLGAGIWFEYVYKQTNTLLADNFHEHYLNLGTDYTVAIGNGINLLAEHFLYLRASEKDSENKKMNFTAFSLTYPIGMIDRASFMVFYNYENQGWYRFINIQRQYDNISLYLIFYWNPDSYNLYSATDEINMFSGKGFQIMLSFNH